MLTINLSVDIYIQVFHNILYIDLALCESIGMVHTIVRNTKDYVYGHCNHAAKLLIFFWHVAEQINRLLTYDNIGSQSSKHIKYMHIGFTKPSST